MTLPTGGNLLAAGRFSSLQLDCVFRVSAFSELSRCPQEQTRSVFRDGKRSIL
jgi:hypothetical protein